jgi:hypothetical protein
MSQPNTGYFLFYKNGPYHSDLFHINQNFKHLSKTQRNLSAISLCERRCIMSDNSTCLNIRDGIPDWITIREAVRLLNGFNGCKIRKSDFYRFALQGKIRFSIYFQSPITLRKIKSRNHKLKLRPIKSSSTMKSFMLAESSFISEKNLTFSTEGRYIHPVQRVIDTTLLGYEYVLIQRLLAHSLKIPSPVTGAKSYNYGITVFYWGKRFNFSKR